MESYEEYNAMSIGEKVVYVKDKADATEGYDNRCIHCGDKVFFVEHTEGLVQGHIYSDMGAKEYRISRICEYCFDEVCKEVEDHALAFFEMPIPEGEDES